MGRLARGQTMTPVKFKSFTPFNGMCDKLICSAKTIITDATTSIGDNGFEIGPIQIDELNDPVGADRNGLGLQASDKGYLNVSLKEYWELLDWTGRSMRADKQGAIPANLVPILQRMGSREGGWCELMRDFGRLFNRAAGQAGTLTHEAERRHQNYLQSPNLSRFRVAAQMIGSAILPDDD